MQTIRRLTANPLSFLGLLLLLAFVIVAVLAPTIAPPRPGLSPYMIPRDGFWMSPRPPCWPDHPFGTTEGQLDVFYGVIWGTRTAFLIGFLVVGLGSAIGCSIGAISAFYGGLVDEVLMRITDVFLSFPFLVAAMVMTTVLGRGLSNMMIALVAFSWMGYARLIRSEILRIREMDYIQAARAYGASDRRLILRHILPNAIYPVVISASMNTGTMVLWAAALSFLGVGTEPGYADWGQMISYARNWIIGETGNPFQYWYAVAFPGGAIFLFVLAWNLIGDAFRDILDPRMRGTR
jgi:peptide/nickel transport system permease protein